MSVLVGQKDLDDVLTNQQRDEKQADRSYEEAVSEKTKGEGIRA
jgi:hypothetical protein